MGVHDRVYAGMANNTVVMTDSNKYRENILNGIAQMYHLNDIDDICMKADKLLMIELIMKILYTMRIKNMSIIIHGIKLERELLNIFFVNNNMYVIIN